MIPVALSVVAGLAVVVFVVAGVAGAEAARNAATGILIFSTIALFAVSLIALSRIRNDQPGILQPSQRGIGRLGVAASVVLFLLGGAIAPPTKDNATHTVTAATREPNPTARSAKEPSTVAPKATTTSTTTTAKPTTTTTQKPMAEADRSGDSRNPGQLYPGRPDIQPDDHERAVGPEPVRFAGWSAYVTETGLVTSPDIIHGGTYLRVHVKLLNRNKDQQDWIHSDWGLIYPTGEVYSPEFIQRDGGLGISGGVVHGGIVEGDIWFNIRDQHGAFYVTWEPSYKLLPSGPRDLAGQPVDGGGPARQTATRDSVRLRPAEDASPLQSELSSLARAIMCEGNSAIELALRPAPPPMSDEATAGGPAGGLRPYAGVGTMWVATPPHRLRYA